jgi:5-methylcytosine-specific restriction endonuclease McrA
MPTRLCSDPTCPEPATYRGRCAAHSRTNERSTNRAGRKLYSTKRWQIVRRKVLFLNPLCECGCGQISTDVHHKQDLDDGGDPWNPENLEALAHDCHSKETRARQNHAA